MTEQSTAERIADLALPFALALALGTAGHMLLALPVPAFVLALALLAAIALPVGLRAPALAGHAGVGPANRVTLMRVVLVALLAGLLPYPDFVATHAWPVLALALVALLLDGADGWLARRRGVATAFGARFDMELDALFILVLCGLAWVLGQVGAWVLLIGAMRYAFVAAGWLWPTLQRPLPASLRRRLICTVQIVALLVCLAPPVAPALASLTAAAALGLLAASFAIDIHWLLRHSSTQTDSGDPA